MGVFQSNVFQNNVFQGPHGAVVSGGNMLFAGYDVGSPPTLLRDRKRDKVLPRELTRLLEQSQSAHDAEMMGIAVALLMAEDEL